MGSSVGLEFVGEVGRIGEKFRKRGVGKGRLVRLLGG